MTVMICEPTLKKSLQLGHPALVISGSNLYRVRRGTTAAYEHHPQNMITALMLAKRYFSKRLATPPSGSLELSQGHLCRGLANR